LPAGGLHGNAPPAEQQFSHGAPLQPWAARAAQAHGQRHMHSIVLFVQRTDGNLAYEADPHGTRALHGGGGSASAATTPPAPATAWPAMGAAAAEQGGTGDLSSRLLALLLGPTRAPDAAQSQPGAADNADMRVRAWLREPGLAASGEPPAGSDASSETSDSASDASAAAEGTEEEA
jgi:hypothetical protein